MQDSISVFTFPVDSVRIATQDITSDKITNLLDFQDSLIALAHLINIEYIAFVCLSYYIIVTRVQIIKTNSKTRRNILIAILTVFWGTIGYYWRGVPILNLLVTALSVNAFWEFIFKGFFAVLERVGLHLPAWYVEELTDEKHQDIARAVKNQKPIDQTPPL